MTGDLVLAEPAGSRLAQSLADRHETSVTLRRRPADLAPLLDDLGTYSLFGGGKVTLVVDSAVFADREGASFLVAEALEVADPDAGGLGGAQRAAASRLLQALHLFGLDPSAAEPSRVLAGLPDWALAGRKKGRVGKRQAAERREKLARLLEAALAEGLRGPGEEVLTRLGDAIHRGLPAGHALVLVERSVASEHPLPKALRDQGCLLETGQVQAERRGGWQGIDALWRQSTDCTICTNASKTDVQIVQNAFLAMYNLYVRINEVLMACTTCHSGPSRA